MSAITRLQLNDGHHIPQFGLGVWQTQADETAQEVNTAVDLGQPCDTWRYAAQRRR